jgi:hypothetical protein
MLATVASSCLIFAQQNKVAVGFNRPRSYCVQSVASDNRPLRYYGGVAWMLPSGDRWGLKHQLYSDLALKHPVFGRVKICRTTWFSHAQAPQPPVRVTVYDSGGGDLGNAICTAMQREHRARPDLVGPVLAP